MMPHACKYCMDMDKRQPALRLGKHPCVFIACFCQYFSHALQLPPLFLHHPTWMDNHIFLSTSLQGYIWKCEDTEFRNTDEGMKQHLISATEQLLNFGHSSDCDCKPNSYFPMVCHCRATPLMPLPVMHQSNLHRSTTGYVLPHLPEENPVSRSAGQKEHGRKLWMWWSQLCTEPDWIQQISPVALYIH